MTAPLLPPGCYDLLPPYAARESALLHALLQAFDGFGYEEVSPPLIEYTDTLLSGRGAALSPQVFRIMDPGADRMMGIRADHTMQIGRIAATRLGQAALPLRLSYAGTVVHAQGEKRGRSRVLKQAGAELIGPFSPEADAEIILVAATALKQAGVKGFVIDLSVPGIVSRILEDAKVGPEMAKQIRDAVSHKDINALNAMDTPCAGSLVALTGLSGKAEEILPRLTALAGVPACAKPLLKELSQVAERVMRARPGDDISVTLDPTEGQMFDYHTGVTFSFFAPGVATDLGRGGRYRIEQGEVTLQATGVTLYVSELLPLLPPPKARQRVLVADAEDRLALAKMQGEGYITLLPLPDSPATEEEAKRMGCGYLYKNNKLSEVA